MVVLRQGENVWIDSSIGVPIGARVKVIDTGLLHLVDDDGKVHRIADQDASSITPMHPTSVEGVEDMICLGDLNEACLLRNLMVRHKQGTIYTYTGSVLVAVNPYQLLPIYTAEQVHMYHSRRLGELPPHVFAIADSCYFNMRRNKRNQCCIISGESGAGKTESTKLMLQYLAAVSGQHSWIEQQILEANPILEAFGNAKTIRNDNSSRFGKYVEIFFNKQGAIEGAHMEQYLLERSRVCHQASQERNYHIFYCLLSGMAAEQKKILSLGDATEYNYLREGNCTTCEGRDDADEFARIRSSLKILTFTERDCWEIFKLLGAILHMGNINFEATIQENLESCDVVLSDHFTFASKLMEVDSSSLGASLTHRSFMTNRERVCKPLNSEQAMDCRDAFVKAIYSKLFIWIFGKINGAIHKTQTDHFTYVRKFIGLLDIFGFENFDKNSFEQLCINFANEQMQQFFVRYIFKLEQEEYAQEDIAWKHIAYSDNQCLLDLLAEKPLNILALIDEESHFPKGTDTTMLNKMNQVHKRSNIYIPPRNIHNMEFGIKHFAGVVYYDCKGFLEKNRDRLSSDILNLIEKSSSKLLRQIFQAELTSDTVKAPSKGRIIMTPKSSLRKVSDSKRQLSTLSSQFRQSLDALMKALTICQPFFIRCIKPNNEKLPKVFDRELCLRQLRYSGMMETIRIRKSGYPIRHTFKEFLERYRVLLKTTDCDPTTEPAASCCNAICKAVIKNKDDWKIGRTKIFLRDFHDSFLEVQRERELHTKAIIITRVLLGHKDRKNFIKKRKAALVLQKHWRVQRDRKEQRKLQLGFARLQAKVRGRRDCKKYRQQRAAAITLQSQTRGFLARKTWKRKRDAVIVLQTHTRGMLVRKTHNRMKTDAFLTAQERQAQALAALELQKRLEALRQTQVAAAKSEAASDQEMVESFFGFLPSTVGGQEGQAPEGFEDLEGERIKMEDVELKETPAEPRETPMRMTGIPEEPSETPVVEAALEDEEDDSEFSFSKFAVLHFKGAATQKHIQQRLRQPLLYHEDESDALACLTVWWIILRFMGDMAEPKQAGHQRVPTQHDSILKNLGQRQARRLSHLVGLDQKLLRKKQKQKERTGKRKPSTIPEEESEETDSNFAMPVIKEDDILIGEGPTVDRPMTSLEKLHIIVGYAIVRRDIRDEIYCQICKQLTNNKNKKNCIRGWLLLSICLGIFPPTELLITYLQRFILRGPSDYASFCSERLQRTLANGARNEPPCWIELQATKTKKLMAVSVTLMDGRSISLSVDSACTSAEMCRSVAEKVSLQDIYGFSIYIALYEKMWSLGSGHEHVMDAISQCEQEVKRQGNEEQHAPWRLYFRKELFAPWHDCTEDPVSTDLIYKQIIRGLKSGDYQSDKDDDLVQLAAKHYYVQHQLSSSPEDAKKVVQECINLTLIETRSEAKWVQLVTAAHTQGPYINSKSSADTVKGEVVGYARLNWPLLFSKLFEVSRISGPTLPQDEFIVAVNWGGLSFREENKEKFLELSYPEMNKIYTVSEDKEGQVVCLSTVRGDFMLKAVRGAELVDQLNMNLEGLIERSVYAVAKQDVNRQDDPTFLSFKKGDVLFLIKDGDYSLDRGWIKGRNERTVQTGAIAMETILVLPTLTKPTDDTLSLLNLGPDHKKSVQNQHEVVNIEKLALISLKEFSFEYFRQPQPVKGHGASRAVGQERLWALSKEPLKQPLLRSLAGNHELTHLACNCFTAILKYMGDYPIKQTRTPLLLTDQIFGPATMHDGLRDEIYCQIMKQLTSNNNGLSMERGWQLLWLCCGLFPPSRGLLRHAQHFLESRPREPLATGCLQRLRGMLSIEARKLPPHQVEVDAIQQNSTQIFHKVHFPDKSAELFEVTTTTKIRDLIRIIANHHMLPSSDGYSVFVKSNNKMVSLDDQDYFFDCLRQLTDVAKKPKKVKEGEPTSMPYLVVFARKLWFNVIPGKDLTADLIFHYPQEMPKYLRGYHSVTKEEMINLAGLLFRIRADADRSQFVMIPKMMKDLVPADQMRAMSPDDWKKHIIASYNKQAGITVDEAKVAFLKVVSQWPMFGCAFFEVKDVLIMHPFSRITNWSSGATYFHMTIGNLVKGKALLCETSNGYRMDDLLTSYVNMYQNERKAVRPRKNSLFPAILS